MSYWSLDKKSCLQYCRHFLVDNGVFHGKLQVILYFWLFAFPTIRCQLNFRAAYVSLVGSAPLGVN